MIPMENILRELYHGNIRPDSGIYPQDSPFVKNARIKLDCLEKLKATLDESQYEIFEKYCDAQGDIEGITRFDTFTYALRFGVLFTLEILNYGYSDDSCGGKQNG